MNERILELARQVWPDPNTSHVNHEKFAELIVRECAKLNKKQSYELSGVIADTEEFGGFNLVCLDTVKRVEQYLASDTLTNYFREK